LKKKAEIPIKNWQIARLGEKQRRKPLPIGEIAAMAKA
jgi:hypothetical protein